MKGKYTICIDFEDELRPDKTNRFEVLKIRVFYPKGLTVESEGCCVSACAGVIEHSRDHFFDRLAKESRDKGPLAVVAAGIDLIPILDQLEKKVALTECNTEIFSYVERSEENPAGV